MSFTPLAILDRTVVALQDCEGLRQEPRFRKASTNMLLAFQALDNLMKPWKGLLKDESAGVVLATSHGELETSKEFLKTYDAQGLARPILFQNSLHNSTLSFVTQALAFEGLAVTTSNSFMSGEKALETAALLLNQNVVQVCFVLGVDSIVADLKPIYDALVPTSFKLGSGCGGVLLASAAFLQKTKTSALGILKGIEYLPDVLSDQTEVIENYYDSNALECLAVEMKRRPAKIHLLKPDGSTSVIDWEGALP